MPASWKIKEVEDLAKMLSESPVIAVASISSLPSRQFQGIRAKTRKDAKIRVIKNRLARLAIEKAKSKRPGLEKLEEFIQGPSALIFTNENPFKIYRIFEENRISAAAKPGDIAPYDIVVPAGDTPFKPGPIIGELQSAGIKAKIQGGIIVITEDSLVVRKGEKISKELASVLSRLEIEPMEIGVNINAAFEDGLIYTPDILHIDTEQTLSRISEAYTSALNLSINAGIYNSASIEYFISKASTNARNLAVEAGIINKESLPLLLAKASANAQILNAVISGEPLPSASTQSEAQTKGSEAEEKKKEEDEKKSEEDAASGLSALFG